MYRDSDLVCKSLTYCVPWKAGNIPILFNQVWVDNDYIMVWVFVLGTKEEAGKLEYSFRIYNVKDRDEERKNYLFWGTMACVFHVTFHMRE